MPFAREGPRVDQLLAADARCGVAGHVADIVGARAARIQPNILQPLDDIGRVLGRDLTNLQVGAGGDMRIAAAEPIGEIGHAGELPMPQNAIRDAQAAHVAFLRRRDVEEAIIPPPEIIWRLWKFIARRLALQLLIGVERMLFALPLLLIGEFLAGRDHRILRRQMRRVGTGRRRVGRRSSGRDETKRGQSVLRARRLDSGDKALKIAFLVWSEIAIHLSLRPLAEG